MYVDRPLRGEATVQTLSRSSLSLSLNFLLSQTHYIDHSLYFVSLFLKRVFGRGKLIVVSIVSLNRVSLGKRAVFIIDFYNKTKDILRDFEIFSANTSAVPMAEV